MGKNSAFCLHPSALVHPPPCGVPIHGQMEVSMVIASLLCAWAILRIMGGERERRVRELVASLPPVEVEGETGTPALPGPAVLPVRSKVGR